MDAAVIAISPLFYLWILMSSSSSKVRLNLESFGETSPFALKTKKVSREKRFNN